MKLNIKDAIYFVIALIALFLLFQISQNGRYQMVRDQIILDTRNGKTYEAIRNGNNKPGGPYYTWQIQDEAIQ